MFQSSSTASGMRMRQPWSPCSPSPASAISKSSPSRIRRATFRMTLESSTTRQVFISSSSLCWRVRPARFSVSSRLGAPADLEHTIDIEDDKQAALEPVHPRRNAGELGIEVDWIVLSAVGRKLHDLADRVYQQTIGFASVLDADRHAGTAVFERRQAETSAHVDGGDDATAQVEQASDLGTGERHA